MTSESRYIETPIGILLAVADENGLILLEFVEKTEIGESSQNKYLLQAKLELAEYFAGKRKVFTVPFTFKGTDFQKKAWQALTTIHYSETRSYQQQAALINNPKAVRAIGLANGKNPISIIVPCHRVIGKDGKLVGYGGGLWRKKWLLEHEQKYK